MSQTTQKMVQSQGITPEEVDTGGTTGGGRGGRTGVFLAYGGGVRTRRVSLLNGLSGSAPGYVMEIMTFYLASRYVQNMYIAWLNG